ncbi:MAG: transcription elongation factor GreA [Candidatus Omnitrophica bacterium]|nr:transcription elongation factor GreA [Candidatus Omnitrophota bacterium]
MDDVYLTRNGYDKLMKELDFLKKDKRRQISKAIGEARAHGDIGENAEYDAAKDAQGLNEKRIVELENKLAHARIIENENMSSDEVLIGAEVEIEDLDTGDPIKYTLVSEAEADYEEGKISVTSPVGAALLNHKKGDIVEIQVPAGTLKYKILKISR